MIGMYLMDEMTVINKTSDEYGVMVKIEIAGIKARIEDRNQLIKDQNGNEVIGECFIILSADIELKYEDKIKITKRGGIAYPLNNKEFAIKKISKNEGFSFSHWEVWI